MFKQHLLALGILLQSCFVLAQSDFNFYADSIQLYAIGEDHRKENAEIQIAIIDYINSNEDVDYVFIELPRSYSEVFSGYVMEGKYADELEKLLDIIPYQAHQNLKSILDHIAEHNSKPENNKIQVRAVDQFGFGVPKVDALALSVLYPELMNCKTGRTREYIFERENYTLIDKTDYLRHLLYDFLSNRDEFESLLGAKLRSYEMDLREGLIDYWDDVDEADSLREFHITSQIGQYMNDTICAITINGASHVTKLKEDSWFYTYPFSSALSQLSADYRLKTCSIILEYPTILRSNSFNVLRGEVKELLKNTDEKYTTLNPTEIYSKYPFAANRCDVVVLCDM